MDAAVLRSLAGVYFQAAARQPLETPDLVGPPVLIIRLPIPFRQSATVGMFLFSGLTILTAEPFAEPLIATGKILQVPEYLLIRWLVWQRREQRWRC